MDVLDLYSLQGEKTGSVTIPTKVINFKPNRDAIYYSVKGHMHHQVQRTVMTKTRSEVRGGGRKPWRQKGTGQARAGSRTSPVWRGGGIVFGPRLRDPHYKVNKNTKRMALRSALYWKIQDKQLMVLESLLATNDQGVPKTKNVVAILKALKLENKKVLLLLEESNDLVWKAARNIHQVMVRTIRQVSGYDILSCEYILTTKMCLESFKEIF